MVFGRIWAHPTDVNTVYFGDVELWKSTDGGAHFNSITGSMHVDNHALCIAQPDPNFMVCGNDGGVFVSTNSGSSWRKCYDLPITQFYAITIDAQNPERLYGGTQDNSTPRTLTGNIDDWDVIFGGDGFYVSVDYTDADVIYAEYQYGYLGKSTDLGYSWDMIFSPYDHGERSNWDTPFVMSPISNQTLYYGAQKIYRTINGGSDWEAFSPDLTGGSGGGSLIFGTITTISPSPLMEDIVWAGTDDSRVWVTTDGGNSWDMVSQNLPDRWCTRVTADPFDIATAYVTFSGYKDDDLLPHIYKTTDFGSSWTDISGNLTDIPVNDILPDPQKEGRLYIGTDFGMFYTDDGGETWLSMSDEMPICPVLDIELHDGARKLVAGTHGRSMYSFDITITSIDNEENKPITDFKLYRNYPNPFNSFTVIPFEVGHSGHYTLKIYDVGGRLVNTVLDKNLTPGNYSVRFKANNLSSGTYFISLESSNSKTTDKMVYVK